MNNNVHFLPTVHKPIDQYSIPCKLDVRGYMYILECADGTYYTGSTKDFPRRMWQHDNFQGANYTRKKFPAILVYYEEFSCIANAFNREKQVQGWCHAKKRALIESNTNALRNLAECKNESKR